MTSGFQAWRVLKHFQTIRQYLIVPAMCAMTDWMDGVKERLRSLSELRAWQHLSQRLLSQWNSVWHSL